MTAAICSIALEDRCLQHGKRHIDIIYVSLPAAVQLVTVKRDSGSAPRGALPRVINRTEERAGARIPRTPAGLMFQ
jgi:hypothetical protein